MQILGIGDLHLSSVNGSGGFSRFLRDSDSMIINELRRVLLKEEIETVIIYGDICDGSRMSYGAHELLYSFFHEFKDRSFHLILGNHDKFARDSNAGHSCQLLQKMVGSNVRIYENPEVVKIGNNKINMLPYPFADFKRDMLNVCHLTLSGAVDDYGRKCKDGVAYKSGCTIVSGHIHSAGEGPDFSYSGTLYQLTFGESIERKGYHVIDIDNSEADVQWRQWVPEYKLKTIEVDESTDWASLADRKCYYRLISDEFIDPALYASLNVVNIKSKAAAAETLELKVEDATVSIDSMFQQIIRKYDKEQRAALKRVRASILK